MAKWFQVRGVEQGEQPPPVLLFSFPGEQWTEELRREVLDELERAGATQVSVKEVEQ